MEDNFERFMVSQSAVLIRDNKFLILQFSNSGNWGLPGGRIDRGETGKIALQREIKEELGLESYEFLGVADYDFDYYQKDGETIAKLNMVNLIKNEEDELTFSKEHGDFRWIAEGEVGRYEYAWPNMERLIKNAFKLKKLLEKNEE
jgi:8-oxo-dGTP diphosphatase